MKKEDEEKNAFYTNHGTFYYTKMPSRLKDVGATYQHLVDTIFRNQIGRNTEFYVEDMVIKGTNDIALLKDIKETFITLETTKMKLNSTKCTFRAEEGQLAG